jgi:hypothetical protein
MGRKVKGELAHTLGNTTTGWIERAQQAEQPHASGNRLLLAGVSGILSAQLKLAN